MLSGGWKGLLYLRDSIIDYDFAGLNDTSHLTAQACIHQHLVRQPHLWGYLQ